MRKIDSFLDDYQGLRSHCDTLDYEGVTNPYDSVFYPGVSLDIPEDTKAEVKEKIESLEGYEVVINAMFLRLSLKGVKAPHQAHTDTIMGEKSFMLYLNRAEDCQGGTALVQHESGLYREPCCNVSRETWFRDHSDPSKWHGTELCEMEENRACIFDAQLMHRAEPIGGFGDNAENGRLVLTAFFSEAA